MSLPSPPLPPPPPPAASVTPDAERGSPPDAASLICASCEYALRGIATDGRCPECGLEIEESIRAAGLWTPKRLRQLRIVVVALGIAWLTWTTMALAFLFPPELWLRLAFIAALLGHAVATVIAAMLGVHAASQRRRAERRSTLSLLSVFTAVPILVLIAALLRVMTPSDLLINAVLIWVLLARMGLLTTAASGLGQAASTLAAGGAVWWRAASILLMVVAVGWLLGLGLPLVPGSGIRNSDLVLGGLMALDALLVLAISVLGIGVFRAASARLGTAAGGPGR